MVGDVVSGDGDDSTAEDLISVDSDPPDTEAGVDLGGN